MMTKKRGGLNISQRREGVREHLRSSFVVVQIKGPALERFTEISQNTREGKRIGGERVIGSNPKKDRH